jgi:hypothetical protein
MLASLAIGLWLASAATVLAQDDAKAMTSQVSATSPDAKATAPADAPEFPAEGALDVEAAVVPPEPVLLSPAETAADAFVGPPSPAPADAVKMVAEVIEVSGDVAWAPAGTSALDTKGWTPVRPGDRLDPGSLIRTGIKAHVNLRFGESTYLSIRRMTLASISAAYRSATEETTRIGLGYGAVRGTSSESTVRSDVVIDTPTATLAKKGTRGFEIFVEWGTGGFNIALADEGLVEAIQKFRSGRARSRLLRPGESVNERSIANTWFQQAHFARSSNPFGKVGLTDADAAFAADHPGGLGVLAPGSGSEATNLAQRDQSGGFTATPISNPGDQFVPTVTPTRVRRPEGNFGTRN